MVELAFALPPKLFNYEENMKKFFSIVLGLSLLISGPAYAEITSFGGGSWPNYREFHESATFRSQGLRCGTDRHMRVLNSMPDVNLRSRNDCTNYSTTIQSEYVPSSTISYVIPVYVHIITTSTGEGNISDAAIAAQISVLNEDFGGGPEGLGFDTQVRFEHVGTQRIVNDDWFTASMSDDYLFKEALAISPTETLNIYTNAADGTLGYATLPDGAAGYSIDGIVMNYLAIGGRDNGFGAYDQGKTLVHEVGHYLGMLHTFSGGSCEVSYQAGDLIVDTNPHLSEVFGCPAGISDCGLPVPIDNFMNYTDDVCMDKFTPEQANRMACSLLNYRSSLYTKQNTTEGSEYVFPLEVWQSFFAVDTRETARIGDFNGDGLTDIVTFTRDNPLAVGDVYVALSDGERFASAPAKWADYFSVDPAQDIVVGDFNGDGKDDMATWLRTTSNQVYVALSTGTGLQEQSIPWLEDSGDILERLQHSAEDQERETEAGDVIYSDDVNGDGMNDLIFFARADGDVYVSTSTGSSFSQPQLWHDFFAVSTYERPRTGDVDGDGFSDILTFATNSPTAFGDVYVAKSTGYQFADKQLSNKWHDFFSIEPTQIIRLGDLDGDGKADMFTFMPPPSGEIYAVFSQGDSMTENVRYVERGYAQNSTDEPWVGDVNGDGKVDVIVFDRARGTVLVGISK